MASRGRKTPPSKLPHGLRAPPPHLRPCLGEDCGKEFMSENGERFCPACAAKDRDLPIRVAHDHHPTTSGKTFEDGEKD